MTERLIACYGTLPKLVSHLHLPVQSGSDRILAAMKRGHTVLEFKSIVRKLREQRPDLCLSSDFIVGFPGETEADFAATMKLIEELDFDASFSFIYSKRPGTPASDYPDDVSAETKTRRLMQLQAKIERRRRSSTAPWSVPCSACGSKAMRARTRTSSPAAPTTTVSSISRGLPG